jgi:CHAT domain-containing protein
VNRKTLGSENPDVASILDMLGNVHRARGEYAKAESLYQKALGVSENFLIPNHPAVAKTLDHLATLLAAKGDGAKAIEFQARSNRIDEQNISLNLSSGSERQKLVYMRTLNDKVSKTISLQLRFGSNDPGSREHAAELLLQRKGRIQDVMINTFSNLRSRLRMEDQKLLAKLNSVNAQLSRLVLEGPEQNSTAKHRERIATLEEQKEKLESDISRASAGFYQQPQTVTLDAIRSVIPEHTALVELAVYNPFDPMAEDAKAYGDAHYVAYVIRKEGEVQSRELGEAKSINNTIGAFRQALQKPQRQDVQELARSVDEKIMQPIRALLGDSEQLLISPDGDLNLIPFEALVDEREHYLVEQYAVTYLTSGRDLLRMQVEHESQSEPLVMANPSFGDPDAPQLASTPVMAGALKDRRRSVTNTREMSEVYFASLMGTEQEAHSIHNLFPQARLLTDTQATESALKQASAPRILHLATHGFFLQDTSDSTNDTQQLSTRGISATAKIENPLLRSGLALAGANLHNQAGDDGILTALEASGLNLWGTKLVALSACDTGLGEVQNGEGVYGLRRAFVLAGAESLVMSLWPVSDSITRELMISYYKGLKQNLGRNEALRQVQLSMINSKDRQHPFYWAGFIQSGEWANLDGKRR